jgi:hypothetical protein
MAPSHVNEEFDVKENPGLGLWARWPVEKTRAGYIDAGNTRVNVGYGEASGLQGHTHEDAEAKGRNKFAAIRGRVS